MNKKLNIISLIPARSGSKGIKDKNIKLYKGLPLLVHSINISLQCKYINETYVSTDSKEYQDIAVEHGSKITPLRPNEISDDLSPDIDTFNHLINMLINQNKDIPDIIVHLRPTYPNRNIDILNNCIEKFIENYDKYDSLRTVAMIEKTPYKMYYIENNVLIPYIKNHDKFEEPYNQARQNFPNTYLHNGCIDIIKTHIILNKNLLSGFRIYPYIMENEDLDDIDNIDDFIKSENK